MNYEHIANAVEFYKTRGYVYIEDAPWFVSEEAYHATKPPSVPDLSIVSDMPGGSMTFGHPVASGEQSFIHMMMKGQPLKRAICVTPCYRHEPTIDMLHRRYFMKAELINAHDVDDGHLIHMIHDACCFFEQWFPVRVFKVGDNAYDIVEKSTRFELGSYGIREYGQLKWIYGTACAEPRLTMAIQHYSKVSGR